MGEHLGLRAAVTRRPHPGQSKWFPRKHPTCLVLHVPKEK